MRKAAERAVRVRACSFACVGAGARMRAVMRDGGEVCAVRSGTRAASAAIGGKNVHAHAACGESVMRARLCEYRCARAGKGGGGTVKMAW